MEVSALYIYPIKSCAAVQVARVRCTEFGFEHDREYAIVDIESHEVMTQRKLPKMATLQPRLQQDGYLVVGDTSAEVIADSIEGPFVAHKVGSVELDTNAWLMSGRLVIGADESKVGDANVLTGFLTAFFGADDRRYGLVRLDHERAVAKGFGPFAGAVPGQRRSLKDQLAMGTVAKVEDTCAFHDVAPYHIASEASLQDLNLQRELCGHPVSMSRFRPNIVVRGELLPWDEDRWARVTAGAVQFRVLQGCVRCTVPTVDQSTGLRPDGQNPTATLRRIQTYSVKTHGPYAKLGPYFGVWAAPAWSPGADAFLRVHEEFVVEARSTISSYAYWVEQMGPSSRLWRVLTFAWPIIAAMLVGAAVLARLTTQYCKSVSNKFM